MKKSQRRPAEADSMSPIWREIMSACRALEAPQRVAFLGPAGTFSEQAALDFFGSPSTATAPTSTKCSAPRLPAARTSAWSAWRTPPKAWWPARSTCSCIPRLHIVGETSLLVRHNLLRRAIARGHRGGLRPSAGAGAVPGLAQPAPAERRAPAVSSNAEGARLAADEPAWRRWPASAPPRNSACTWWRSGPGRRAQPHPLRHVSQPQTQPRRRPPGKDCTSLIVSVANPPGAVHDMLVPLKTMASR